MDTYSSSQRTLALFVILCFVIMTVTCESGLRISAWNSRGLRAARSYLDTLMAKSDIVALSEHQLYEAELNKLCALNKDFCCYGKSSDDLKPENYGRVPGHCGVAIFWRRTLSSHVRPLKGVGTDRVCAIEYRENKHSKPVYIVSVYLPQPGCGATEFNTHLDALEGLFNQWLQHADVIALGDWNAHFGPEAGPRGHGASTRNAKAVVYMMQRNPLVCADLLDIGQGPIHTYCSTTGNTSYIDHCIVSKSLITRLKQCVVLNDTVANTSDHLPLHTEWVVKSDEPTSTQQQSPTGTHVAWHKYSQQWITEHYTTTLESLVQQYTRVVDIPSQCEQWPTILINDVAENVVTMALQASESLVKPVPKQRKNPKHYWTKNLTQLSKQKQSAWKVWTEHGSPRGPDNELWVSYQQAKKQFRREQRRAQTAKENEFLHELEHQATVDQRAFWSLLNGRLKQRTNPQGVQPFTLPDGTVLTDESEIREAWRKYFQDLYSEKSPPQFNNTFKDEIEQRLKDIGMDATLNYDRIHVDDVQKTCRSLKTGKAPGFDRLQGEHLKFGGPSYLDLVTQLFNAIVATEWRPPSMKQGLIVAIPKGSKDHTIPDNNRGITLMPVLSKVLDTILLSRAEDWISSKLDELQEANRRGISCIVTAAILQEAMHRFQYQTGTHSLCGPFGREKSVRYSVARRNVRQAL